MSFASVGMIGILPLASASTLVLPIHMRLFGVYRMNSRDVNRELPVETLDPHSHLSSRCPPSVSVLLFFLKRIGTDIVIVQVCYLQQNSIDVPSLKQCCFCVKPDSLDIYVSMT